MQQVFRSSIEHVTGATIVKNGVSHEIITLDPLYLESDETIPYLVKSNDAATMSAALSEDSFYSGYHIMKVEELDAIKNICCAWHDTPPPNQPVMPYASQYWYWKDASEIPGGLTGVEWVRQTLGIKFDGYKRISVGEDGNEVLTLEAVGTGNFFWLGDSLPDPYNGSIKVFSASTNLINSSTTWGPGVSTIMRGIILVKNYE